MKPVIKQIRLDQYDYSGNGAYFITICTKDRKQILSRIAVGTSIARPPAVLLSEAGKITEEAVLELPKRYAGVVVDYYVIMPNHVHILLRVEREDNSPTISHMVQQLKGAVTKRVGESIWQGRFYDHVIRDENDYLIRAQYIENNPAKWTDDKYYSAE